MPREPRELHPVVFLNREDPFRHHSPAQPTNYFGGDPNDLAGQADDEDETDDVEPEPEQGTTKSRKRESGADAEPPASTEAKL